MSEQESAEALEKTGNDGGVNPRLGIHPGRDAERHGERERHDAHREAGGQVPGRIPMRIPFEHIPQLRAKRHVDVHRSYFDHSGRDRGEEKPSRRFFYLANAVETGE